MNKQQFFAMSLRHKLCVISKHGNSIGTLTAVCGDSDFIFRSVCVCGREKEMKHIKETLPILYHLSDLTKDEWIERLNTFACELLDAAHVYDEKNIVGLNWMTQPFEIVMWLVKNHFNLMDESEPFIDINTLEINPYK